MRKKITVSGSMGWLAYAAAMGIGGASMHIWTQPVGWLAFWGVILLLEIIEFVVKMRSLGDVGKTEQVAEAGAGPGVRERP